MNHITQCDPKDYSANAECQQREFSLYPVHHGKPEKSTENDWQQKQRNSIPSAEGYQQEYQHQNQCPCNGGRQIMLNLCGVIVTTRRRSMIGNTNLRMGLSELRNLSIQQLEHRRTLSCICRREVGRDKCYTDR